jgi:hypothetical protein
MHATFRSRVVLLALLAVACGVVLVVGVVGVVGGGSSSDDPPSSDPVSTVDPEVQHCLDAGGEPSWTDGEVVCLIPPATLQR